MVDPHKKQGTDSIEQADAWMAEAAALLARLERDLNAIQRRREINGHSHKEGGRDG